MSSAVGSVARLSVRVGGTVQGVGFRPHVHRLATELGLAGYVRNDERGVEIEVEGAEAALAGFLDRLGAEAPPLARMEAVTSERIDPRGARGFEIVASAGGGRAQTQISPDVATCADCLSELFDPADRRHRYPFINCTNCGPRFTIVTGIPYDRPQTTMAGFEMCERCRAEYEDPGDRRFHAQPNACPDCGPRARLLGADGADGADGGDGGDAGGAGDPVQRAAEALRGGLIVAVKGIGGYHLACRADDERAVAALRARKHREDKPFALLARDADAAGALAELSEAERELLAGPERPIVIARRRDGAPAAPSVAPFSADLGVMLPYSPLHHLLVADAGLDLVMTSANVSDEPIAFEDADARARLGAIADRFLVHDRPIHTRTDDSVVRALEPALRAEPIVLRRSRGMVPRSLPLPRALEVPVLACGAELKNTFCLARGDRAWVSHHVGDLKNFETLASFRDGIGHLERLLEIEPEIVAHDLHPDYLSTTYALERPARERVGVQHHHAHLAAVLGEHGREDEAVGAIFDGSGYGPDGTVWGGELLVGGAAGCRRGGLLFPVRLPGGDKAVEQPWRMACAWLAAAFGTDEPPVPATLGDALEEGSWEAISELCRTGLASPLTTSAGRLFDAVAALCGIRPRVSYEGQAAVELEALAAGNGSPDRSYPMPVVDEDPGPLLLDARETIRAVHADAEAGTDPGLVAARFHAGLADATVAATARLAERAGTDSVALAGGVFANRLLIERCARGLSARGLRVLLPLELPPGDGAISYGQAVVAAAQAGARDPDGGEAS